MLVAPVEVVFPPVVDEDIVELVLTVAELEAVEEVLISLAAPLVVGLNINCVEIMKAEGKTSVTIIKIKLNIITGSLRETWIIIKAQCNKKLIALIQVITNVYR